MAQPVSFGIKAGAPLSDLVNAASVYEPRRLNNLSVS
jgi:hypothetical protein